MPQRRKSSLQAAKDYADIKKMGCWDVSTKFMSRHHQISRITKFYPSAVLEHDDPGIVLIRDWLSDKSIIIPKTNTTILQRELERITDDNTSFVINPFKLLIVGFEIQNKLFLPTLGHVDTSMVYKTYGRYIPNLTHRDGSAFEKLYSESTSKSVDTNRHNLGHNGLKSCPWLTLTN